MVISGMDLQREGWALADGGFSPEGLAALREAAFATDRAGERCLLDVPAIADAAVHLKSRLVREGVLPAEAVAIQAIAFDKTPGTNWKVAWHQDLMFPLANEPRHPGYATPSRKGGVNFARPPLEVLHDLLAARLHLDDCGTENGPLRVSPGTHRLGFVPSADAAAVEEEHGPVEALAAAGEVLLMRPLLLHASSQSRLPHHRRVLHFVYHTGSPVPEPWHRTV